MLSIPKGSLGHVIIGHNGESFRMVSTFLYTDHKKGTKFYRTVACDMKSPKCDSNMVKVLPVTGH